MKELVSLETLLNPVVYKTLYPASIRKLLKVPLEKVKLERPYIDGQIDYEEDACGAGCVKILSGPTSCGKSTSIVGDIAKKTNGLILIAANRNILTREYKYEVAKALDQAYCYTLEGLDEIDKIKNVYFQNYQGIASFIKENAELKFNYIILDECHFFLEDAPFSDCTDYVLKILSQKFPNAIRVYISATIDEVLPYIITAEFPGAYVDDYDNVVYENIYGEIQCINQIMPKLYTMDPDYTKMTLKFYDDTDELLRTLDRRNDKILFFGNTVEECKEVKDIIDDTLVVYSKLLREDKEIMNKLVTSKKFEEKCMATTSVFSNGNNIKDTEVKSVIVEHINPVQIVQMAGRRRINFKMDEDGFDLYLKIPKLSELKTRFIELNHKLNLLEKCQKNPSYVLYAMKKEDKDSKFIQSVYRVDYKTKTYKLNQLSYDKLYADRSYIAFLHALIEEKGEDAYCELICKLFMKEFNRKMLIWRYDDKVKELKNFVEDYKFPIKEEKFPEFSEMFTKERIKLFGELSSDNPHASRKNPGVLSINRRLKELEIPLKILKIDGYCVLKYCDWAKEKVTSGVEEPSEV